MGLGRYASLLLRSIALRWQTTVFLGACRCRLLIAAMAATLCPKWRQVPQGESRSKSKTSGMSVVGVQQIDRVVEVVEQTLRGNMVRLMTDKKVAGKKEGGASLSLPKIRRNPLVEIIPINTGCLNQCTYCKTKHARGDLGSYSVGAIMDRVREVISGEQTMWHASLDFAARAHGYSLTPVLPVALPFVAEGVVEIWLTSEDTGAYGRDIGTNIVELLTAILGAMPEGTMLRLGMTNPPYILEHVEAMARLLQHPRMYCYLHVPVQAGSDEILYAMRREYTQEDFRHVVDSVRAGAPGVTIATDIIAGFPGETDGDFEETYQLCKEYEFPCLYINQFFSRPGTPAAAMEKCDTKMVKGRTKRLTELFRSYFPHKEKVGNVYTVLAAEESTDKKFYVAHNKCYDQILVPKRDELLGRVFDVKVTEAGKFHMIGEVIEESLARSPPRRTPLAQGAISGSKGKGSRSTAPHMMRKGGLPALAGQATTEPPPAGTCCGGAGAKADGGGCCGGMGKPSASSAAAADRAESSAGCCGGAGSKPAGGACCGGAKKAPTSTDPTTLRNRKATPLQLASEQDALPSAEITPAVAVATARLLTFDRKALLATAFVVLALDLCRIAVNYYVA